MTEPALSNLYPIRRASDYWGLLKDHVPDTMVANTSWDKLANAALALPGSGFGLERTLASSAISQFGFHLWPWCMDIALARAAKGGVFGSPHPRLADHLSRPPALASDCDVG